MTNPLNGDHYNKDHHHQSSRASRAPGTRAVPWFARSLRCRRVRLGDRHGRPSHVATMSHGSWKDDEHYRDHFEEGERRRISGAKL